MTEAPLIVKNPVLTPDQDYAFLRREGLKYIEELGSRLWTDYNEHDPGVTILEALCYAITELGYRSSLPMKDLLTEEDGTINGASQAFYSAKTILTQSPLTLNDYRKLLIDVAGVHNAWLFSDDFYAQNGVVAPAGEAAVYADCKEDRLSYAVTPHPVYLSGLYKVLLDLDNDAQFGDLNNGNVTVLNPETADLAAGKLSLTVSFDAWNAADPALLAIDANTASFSTVSITPEGKDWKIAISFSADGLPKTAEGLVVVDLPPAGRNVGTADIVGFFTPHFSLQVLTLYLLKIQKSKTVVADVTRTLNENRNLCEDFVSVATVQDEEIAVCCDVDVRPDADMERVQAAVFLALEEYLNPSPRFYLLKEMLDRGCTTDEIFEGPVLKHGFLDTKELEATNLRQEIYASDVINLLMDIDGVQAVRGFRMTKYDKNGDPVPGETGKSWCLSVGLWHKPVLSETKSKLIFYKNGFPYLPGLAEVRDTLRWLRALNMRNKLNGAADDLPLPTGSHYDLDAYTSIEYLFPLTYGIGKAGLPKGATDERKAQAKQLKAYLLFYDQLLADFFSQLKGAKALLSTDAAVQTYHAQFLGNGKEMDAVYKKDAAGNNLLQTVLENQDSGTAPSWQNLYETEEKFIDRRNRFLDHLMARFAESFNDYVLLMYSLDFKTQKETRIDPATLIANKIDFLKIYPEAGYQRDRANNYCPQVYDALLKKHELDVGRLWDSDNVSGLEKKLSKLAAIKKNGATEPYRRFLYCSGHATLHVSEDAPPKFSFSIRNESGDVLTSAAAYDDEAAVNKAVVETVTYLLTGTNFLLEETGGHWNLFLADREGKKLAGSNDFADKTSALRAKKKFVEETEEGCNAEGLHAVEHILLRPRNQAFALAPVCLGPGCDFCGEHDPYSFRLSVVVPYWPKHFRSLAFRAYFENLVKQEAPAHLMIKICWVNNTALHAFETAYKDWIEALARYADDGKTVEALQEKNDALLQLLYTLHSEYPEATLHDCDESKDTVPVMLGKTILGAFKM